MLDKKPSTIGRMFDRIALRYDLVNRVLSLWIDQTWRHITVRNLTVKPGDRVLDIATGTGDLALRALQSEKMCRVVGIDLSQEMLAIASRKSRRRGFSDRSFFVNGDALLLPFRDGVFDRAMVAFGIRNMNNIEAFLDELHRVITVGGRAAILEFSLPSNPLIRHIYLVYLTRILPLVGRFLSGDDGAYRYLTDSVLEFSSPSLLRKFMRKRGFDLIGSQRLFFGIAHLFILARKQRPTEMI
ncbi:MAG: hypothetical protein AVO39_10800 [delta proteobacterium MLS_D]|jgi:demethylmenaquinone methyltransferase / 2-methoxy-6-polyprenyl-1,4-benzoquinol methylase|nr:MAG: hypothetical protein AVO39_10800 [delta proteobacterium MLS_D]